MGGFDSVRYVAHSESLLGKGPDELKKTPFYANSMGAFTKLKKFQHKSTAAAAKAEFEKEQEAKKAIKAAAKAKKEAEKKEAAEKKAAEQKEAGIEGDEDAEKQEEEAPEEEEEEEVEEPPAVMEDFAEEDWMLAQLRAELHTVLWAFHVDVNDEERISFPAIHFPFYYQLYTGKNFSTTLSNFNCKTLEELTRLAPEICKHTACMDEFALRKEKKALISEYDLVLPELAKDVDVSQFVALTDEARQNRTDRLDAGDENAALTFVWKPHMNSSPAQGPRSFVGGAQKAGQAQKPGQAPANNQQLKRPQPAYSGFNDTKRANTRGGTYRR